MLCPCPRVCVPARVTGEPRLLCVCMPVHVCERFVHMTDVREPGVCVCAHVHACVFVCACVGVGASPGRQEQPPAVRAQHSGSRRPRRRPPVDLPTSRPLASITPHGPRDPQLAQAPLGPAEGDSLLSPRTPGLSPAPNKWDHHLDRAGGGGAGPARRASLNPPNHLLRWDRPFTSG